jgi:hypothetical protein
VWRSFAVVSTRTIMMSVVAALRQNDPRQTHMIAAPYEPSDAALAEAMQQNVHVTKVSVDFDGVGDRNWPCLLPPVLETHPSLENITLGDAAYYELEERLPLVHSLPFIRAIQRNPRLRSVFEYRMAKKCLPFWIVQRQSPLSICIDVIRSPPRGKRAQEISQSLCSATGIPQRWS